MRLSKRFAFVCAIGALGLAGCSDDSANAEDSDAAITTGANTPPGGEGNGTGNGTGNGDGTGTGNGTGNGNGGGDGGGNGNGNGGDSGMAASDAGADGSGNGGDGAVASDGGRDGGPPAAVNGCVRYENQSQPNAKREIEFGRVPRRNEYDPSCITIRAGQSVTWRGPFQQFPLGAFGGSPNNPIATVNIGTAYSVTFPTAGIYGFRSSAQPTTMLGAIQVQP